MRPTVRLVLLPALDGTGVFFEPLRNHLPSWVSTKVLTYPAQGPHDYESLCNLLVDELPGGDGVHLLGWSFGGPLALMIAERLGRRAKSVTLCATFLTPPIRSLVPLRAGLRGPVVGLVRGLWRTRFVVPRIGTPAFRAAKSVTWSQVSSHALAARGRAIMGVDVRDTLQRLSVPLLYLAGSHDHVVGPRSAAEVMDCRPDARLEYLPGGHFALFNESRQAASTIAAFVSESAGTAVFADSPISVLPRRER